MADIAGVAHHYGKVKDFGDGTATYASRADKSKVHSAQRDGQLEERDATAEGTFERFKENGQLLTANSRYDDGTPCLHSYVGVDATGL